MSRLRRALAVLWTGEDPKSSMAVRWINQRREGTEIWL